MANNKSIRELLIQVKQKNLKPTTKDVENLSEALNDAAIYADDLSNSISKIKVPSSIGALSGGLEDVNEVLQSMDDYSRRAAEASESMLEQLQINAEAARIDTQALGESVEDLGYYSRAASTGVQQLGTQTGTFNTKAGKTEKQVKKVSNRLKDVNRQGTNSVRTFSSMASSAGGVASMYAVVAANVFAVSEAFRLLNEAAATDRLEEATAVMSGQLGVSILGVAEAMQEATDGAVSYQQAMKQAAAATAYGFDSDTISDFTQVARRASVVLGVEMTDALNRVIRGVSKAEVELLDELGVTVRLNEAFAKYAAAHNLSADSLNSFQRQQALANEVIKKSEQNLGAVDSQLQSTSWEKFGANVSSATNDLLIFVSTSDTLTSALNYLNDMYDTYTNIGKAARDSTPEVDTLNKAISMPGALDNVKALDSLLDRMRQVDRLRTRASRAQTSPGRDADEHEIYKDALNQEAMLLERALTGTANMFRWNTEQIKEMSGAAKNLSLISRSLSSDLAGFVSDLSGESNPFASMRSSAEEAITSVTLLTDNSISLAEALAQLKMEETDYELLTTAIEYANLIDKQIASTGDLYTAKRLLLDPQQQSADSTTMELKHLQEQYAIASRLNLTLSEQAAWKEKLFVAEQKSNAENAKLITQEYARENATASFISRHDETITKLEAQLFLEQDRLKVQQTSGIFKANELKAQEDTVKELSRAITSERERLELQKIQRGFDEYALALAHQQEMLDVKSTDSLQQELASQQGILASMQEITLYSADDLYNQEQKVVALQRQVELSQEMASRALEQGNLSGMESSMGTLSSDMYNIYSSINMATDAWEAYGQSAKTAGDLAMASANTTGSALNTVASAITMAGDMATSSIETEINMLQAKGDLTADEEKQLLALNKKKIKEQEKYTKATILMQTAAGVAMALGSAPPPLNFVNAALTAAAGAMAYQQASNASASQLASLSTSAASSSSASLELGDRDTSVDVSSTASASERNYNLGDRGIYGRSVGGSMLAGKTYLAGETGTELITPKVDSTVAPTSQAERDARLQQRPTLQLQINALDARSILDRSDEILDALEEGANQRGQSLIS